MQLLRSLARRQGMHAYVLPGEEPGKSIGCFKSFPTKTDGLPPLILLGAERNVAEFNPTNNAQHPAKVTASILNIFDKKITQGTSDFGKLDLLGEETTFAEKDNTATQILSPGYSDAVDLDQAVTAEALRSSYSTEATGSLLNETYSAILTPYQVVSVCGANQRHSGDYLIRKVTHSLTRSFYSQSFTLQRNARSSGSSAGLANLAGSII
jgi:phage protein D